LGNKFIIGRTNIADPILIEGCPQPRMLIFKDVLSILEPSQIPELFRNVRSALKQGGVAVFNYYIAAGSSYEHYRQSSIPEEAHQERQCFERKYSWIPSESSSVEWEQLVSYSWSVPKEERAGERDREPGVRNFFHQEEMPSLLQRWNLTCVEQSPKIPVELQDGTEEWSHVVVVRHNEMKDEKTPLIRVETEQ